MVNEFSLCQHSAVIKASCVMITAAILALFYFSLYGIKAYPRQLES